MESDPLQQTEAGLAEEKPAHADAVREDGIERSDPRGTDSTEVSVVQ